MDYHTKGRGCKMLQEREVLHYGFGILISDI